MYLIETKAILFAAFSALSHLTFLADQGFIQDFWRGGGIYWCINEARKRDTDCTDFSINSQILGGGRDPSFPPPLYETLLTLP